MNYDRTFSKLINLFASPPHRNSIPPFLLLDMEGYSIGQGPFPFSLPLLISLEYGQCLSLFPLCRTLSSPKTDGKLSGWAFLESGLCPGNWDLDEGIHLS